MATTTIVEHAKFALLQDAQPTESRKTYENLIQAQRSKE